MFDLHAALYALAAALVLAAVTWLASLAKRDVSIVDSIWSVCILGAASAYVAMAPQTGPRIVWLMPLAALWALRLAVYITWRNWGEPEDQRYQEIRKRNQPHFAFKSLYLVFVLQAVLAWIVAAPLAAAATSWEPLNALDALGAALCVFGIVFESTADYQLARFKQDARNKGRVMAQGLWRWSRHPNYFGEFCVWWGIYLIALSAGAAWTVVSPLLMTVLLLKVSGVALLEKDIVERRPAYNDYMARTSAFFPRPPRRAAE